MYELIEKRRKLFSILQKLEEDGLVKENIVSKLRMLIVKDYNRLLKAYQRLTVSTFNKRLLRHIQMTERLIWDAVKQDQLKELKEIGAVKSKHKFVNQKEITW